MVAIRSAFALLLVVGCAQQGWSQQAAPLAVSPQQIMASIKSPTDITPIRDGIRDGVLFRAAPPVSEDVLRHKDGTPSEASFTVPLMIDRVQNRLSVSALVNGRKVRLILDTGAMPIISLNQTTAQGIELTDKVSIQQVGAQGYEPVTLGLAKTLTLGNLTLQQIPTSMGGSNPFYSCSLGLSAFEHYRVTLDFAASTMTLTRGGAPVVVPNAGSALLTPFEDENGYLFVPVHVLGEEGWAFLDSGSDANLLSFEAATAAAIQLPPSDAKTVTSEKKIGAGNTARKFKLIGLKAPVPISMNTVPGDARFSTTSQFGTSDIDDVLDASFSAHTHIAAQLGFPFLLQFQRVTIDYPSHTLILQYPAHDRFVKVTLNPTNHDEPWPGYKWQQVGYAWIEVPNGKRATAPITPTMSSSTENGTTTITRTTVAGTTVSRIFGASHAAVAGHVTVKVSSSSIDGNITVAINGVDMVYPPGSTITVEDDGSMHSLPPSAIQSK